MSTNLVPPRAALLAGVAALLATACIDDGDPELEGRPPTIGWVVLATVEDTAVTTVLPITDPDGDDLTILVGEPEHGTAAVAGAAVTYTPSADFYGGDQLPVEISDGVHVVAARLAIEVAPINDAPIAIGDWFAGSEAVALDLDTAALLANDRDVDGPSLAVIAVAAGSGCAVTLDGGRVHFVPASDFSGPARFSYVVSDGALSAVGAVVVDVEGRTAPPAATTTSIDR